MKLTITKDFFKKNNPIKYWRFKVIYSFETTTSSSSLNFVINQPPSNGSCSINPSNGTTSTLFNISCLNWFDEDGIKDYTVYGKLLFSYMINNHFFFLLSSLDK